jgi:hypothetical protein
MAINYIKYNSNQLPSPTPLVELSRENAYNNNHLGYIDSIVLRGQLTGNFNQLQTGQSGILNIFNQNFGLFEIYEATDRVGLVFQKIYEKSGINIKSISFDEAPYYGLINYNIELNCSTMSGNVINPVNQYNFVENKDKTISLSHNVSAQGINTAGYPSKSNALENAINFVVQNTGLANVPTIKFISGASNNFYLQNISESIDRLNATYSIDEYYTNSLLNTGASGILKYSLDITSGVTTDSINLSLKGSYKGPLGGNINDLRNSLNATQLVSSMYSSYFNPIPINYNISENTGENIINFDYSFDNISLPNPYLKYETSVQKDEVEQVMKVDINGSIVARGNRYYRYFLSQLYTSSLTGQFKTLADNALVDFKDFNSDTGVYTLRLQNIDVVKNPKDGTITAKVSYDDKPMPTGIGQDITDSSFQVSIQAPYWYMSDSPTMNKKGYHIINDFNITTLPKLTIESSFSAKNDQFFDQITTQNKLQSTTTGIAPIDYNFNKTIKESFSIEKGNLNKSSELNQQILNTKKINYRLEKVCTDNQTSLFPKVNI